MAKELSVKVKVKLDTTKSSLEDELKKVTEYTQKNPVTIDVKVNKTSLKKSLDEAFGKGAAKSLENIQKQAKSASNVLILADTKLLLMLQNVRTLALLQ